MHITFFNLLCILIYGRFAICAESSAPQNYDKICPSQDNTVKALDGDYRILYHCDAYPTTYDAQGTFQVQDPDSCAQICQRKSGCRGAIWSAAQQTCWTSEDQSNRLIPYQGLLYLKHVEGTPEQQPKEPMCDSAVAACTQQKDICEKQSAITQAEVQACKEQKDVSDKQAEAFSASLIACEAQKEIADRNSEVNKARLTACETQKDVCDKQSEANAASIAACNAQKDILEKRSQATTTQLTSCGEQNGMLEKRLAANSAQLTSCQTQNSALNARAETNSAQLTACESQKATWEKKSKDDAARVTTCEASREALKTECAKNAEGKIKPNLYTIMARHCNKFVDLKDGQTADGTKIQLWEKSPTLNQRYFIYHVGNEEYLLRNQRTGTYVTASGT
ncbi:hypothetical protein P170DRAFT_427571 [Aspergillus steynii IBT 23096]|uniref:Uncharacterized protein n=1 Tax=Aspergillus steynii IBT 23096 TaxID=1392250 RepID=A0A2I2G6I1_9EURO|nr:uncharacterized protein P170DRAFT_427571 [Aspergillus steynii IBT 23096]PLB48487.1 hypothetical protein P170DRAFT_427571 [Aspergillus steynii IBT 23096]